ncbi:MAG TPA: hypothetical protein VFZ61_11595, partial [Polyangiales bacterium]
MSLSLFALLACADPVSRRDASARVVILPREVDELDPRYVGDAYGLKLSRLLYASLVTIDPDSLAPRLDLAESVDRHGALQYRVVVRAG